jgi:2-hydroxychromene-2-carboxylate isomerase
MAAPTPQFLFDFGSPNAYLSHLVIPAIEQRTGTRFDYVPVLLGGIFKLTNNRSPVEAFAGVRNKLAFHAVETRRFVARYGIKPYAMNPFFPVNTLLLMRGAVAAQLDGVFARYVDAAFHHMWGEPKNMADLEVATAAMTASGLDAARLFARTRDDDVKNRLMANTQAAVERGAFGAPTFFVGDEMFFGKEQLREVEELLVAAKPAA